MCLRCYDSFSGWICEAGTLRKELGSLSKQFVTGRRNGRNELVWPACSSSYNGMQRTAGGAREEGVDKVGHACSACDPKVRVSGWMN